MPPFSLIDKILSSILRPDRDQSCRQQQQPAQHETSCWHGDWSRGVDNFAPKLSGSQQNRRNCSCVPDPTGSGATVARVFYGRGTTSPSADLPGGANFYAYPYNDQSIGEAVRLEYELFLSPDWCEGAALVLPAGSGTLPCALLPNSLKKATFEWLAVMARCREFNKGGKLPGLNGGKQGVSGGHHDDGGFSVRLMWRREGEGEAYIYVPADCQAPEFSHYPPRTKVDGHAGVSFARGAWRYTPGRWMRIAITVRLNSVVGGAPAQDGLLRVDIDGETKIRYDRLVWRKSEAIQVDNVFFSTFYG
jgi:hypothetical protein